MYNEGSWQAIEDFNGHLYLAIFDSNKDCIGFKSNYERTPGKLIEDINNIVLCVNTEPCDTTTETPDCEYQKLTSKDSTGWWIVADPYEIYWDSMHRVAEKEFKNNKHKIKWE
jgi:hypothetical protein